MPRNQKPIHLAQEPTYQPTNQPPFAEPEFWAILFLPTSPSPIPVFQYLPIPRSSPMAHQVPEVYGSSSANAVAATAASATAAQGPTTLQLQQQQFAQEFWEEQIVAAEQFNSDFKNHPLPLARIKKVMKSDPDVKASANRKTRNKMEKQTNMISAEAPILFSKACEIFICEMTRRAWLHAEESKRRTLQRSDVASAVSRSDQFDFLIDIVPREEPTKPSKRSAVHDDTTPGAEAYDDQQQQYSPYYPQGAGGLAGYAHAIEATPFYQSMSPEQFQQYMQYQQQQQTAAAQTYQAQQHEQHSSATVSSRGGSSTGYATQEPASRQI
ncbi:hypothetical protein BGZ98_009412 [Dissophora globulifera]|nr:hypothetical protein BGZ98_009412 [Dissophora globulifera]